MPKPDPNAEWKIDGYIDEVRPFAQPILRILRELIHEAHPEIEEDWKWGGPAYSLNGLVCMTWAFQRHASITFYYGSEIDDWAKVFENREGVEVAFNRRIKFTEASQIQTDVILDYVAQAAAINESGRKPRQEARKTAIVVRVPPFVKDGFKGEPKAYAFFEGLSPSARRDFCRWIMDAKQEATRIRRREKLIEAMRAENKRVY